MPNDVILNSNGVVVENIGWNKRSADFLIQKFINVIDQDPEYKLSDEEIASNPATAISNATPEVLFVGEWGKLAVKVVPFIAGTPNLVWESSNPAVLVITSDGYFRAIATGTATITATDINNPEVTMEASIEVIAALTKATVTLDKEEASVVVEATVQLTAETNSTATIIFESSDEEVATVSEEGLITGVAAGTAVITAKVEAEGKYTSAEATCAVTVTAE